MKKQLGVQLYSLRRELNVDFTGTLKQLAAMGYDGVELAGLPQGVSPEAATALFKSLKLTVVGGHSALPFGGNALSVLDGARLTGCRTLIFSPGNDQFASSDMVKRNCEQINAAAQNASAAGMRLALHNHWWEFALLEGRPAFELMLEHLAPEVVFELDTYWARTGGADPVSLLKRLGKRVPLVHIKDGPCVLGQPMVAAGTGAMQFPPILEAAQHAEWLVVELDECATDMLEAVRNSLTYLRQAL